MRTNLKEPAALFTFTKDVFKEKHRFLRSGILNYYNVIASCSFSEFSDTGQDKASGVVLVSL